jgi:aminoglycoside phosphotransferase (APT) family kinase protein
MSRSFEDRLAESLARTIPGFETLVSVRRLSGGASQETHRVEIETSEGPRTLAVRRAAKGVEGFSPGPGLAGEAELFRIARAAGVPAPEVFHVFTADEGLGEGWSAGASCAHRSWKRFAPGSPSSAARCSHAFMASIPSNRVSGIASQPSRPGTTSTRSGSATDRSERQCR